VRGIVYCKDSFTEALLLVFYYQDRTTKILVGIFFTEEAEHFNEMES